MEVSTPATTGVVAHIQTTFFQTHPKSNPERNMSPGSSTCLNIEQGKVCCMHELTMKKALFEILFAHLHRRQKGSTFEVRSRTRQCPKTALGYGT